MCRTASSLILYQVRLMQFTSNLILSSNLCFHPLYHLVPLVFGLKCYTYVKSPHPFYVPAIIHNTLKSGKQHKLSSCSLLSSFPPLLLLPNSCIHILSLTFGNYWLCLLNFLVGFRCVRLLYPCL